MSEDIYTAKENVRGVVQYRKNGRLISLNQYDLETPFEPETIPEDPVSDRACVFCRQYSRFSRQVNGQSLYVCDLHYYSESLGSIITKARERNLVNG
ncbi:hypothetical protein UFOVP1522_18 [uncultured Caudovirales phage]|uniref:Uncharacterized protein n=1 Tax=uncultured Caudovirales phage TaxID=2100421 RepID=A0A6J5QDT6_9CAUD|nr:hypothetical protein UFOVP989_5 [uncultured Caudovirales phage]CAB4181712.1 hypothetical protein UFOVP1075_61 [uncultured Caudovirales phage]CAB4198762.1 hypothetical protein UFOVP1312_53 [uncultured Caudovirales phage]CAB4210367.1 hypothetical protein UFOVP1426_5 [uncultured Caudovirales phage]CAB5227247.1 hypothetical protein UFOVP1522_18 [uncultured Caudovirales phage]